MHSTVDLGWGVAAEHGGGAVVDDVGDDVHEGGPVVEGGLGLGADESQLTQDRLIGTFRDAVGPGRVRCGEVVVTSQVPTQGGEYGGMEVTALVTD